MKKHVLVFDTSQVTSTHHDKIDEMFSAVIRDVQKHINPKMDKNEVINAIAAKLGHKLATWPGGDGKREVQFLLMLASHAVFNVVMLQSAFGEN